MESHGDSVEAQDDEAAPPPYELEDSSLWLESTDPEDLVDDDEDSSAEGETGDVEDDVAVAAEDSDDSDDDNAIYGY